MTDDQFKQLIDALSRMSAAHVPLKEHIEARLVSMDKAVEEARRQMELKMDGFPSQFVRKGEIDSNLARVEEQLCSLNEFRAKADGMASQKSVVIVWWVSFTSIVLALIGIVLRLYKV